MEIKKSNDYWLLRIGQNINWILRTGYPHSVPPVKDKPFDVTGGGEGYDKETGLHKP